jgi:hypothetical protein
MQNNLEKPKFKHNKKRNSAFLFESLVKELTKSIVYDDKERQKLLSSLIKQHFNKNNILYKELNLYKQLYETKEFPKEIAEKLVDTIKSEHEKLNETEIYNEQSKLIAKINKFVGSQVFSNFVPNYKNLATISQIFNKNVETKQKILLEQELINSITDKVLTETKEARPVENSVINRFVERFNEAYNESLLKEQKDLLSAYINASDESIDLKVFIHEELLRLSGELKTFEENDVSGNAKKVRESLESLKIESVSDELIKKIMYAQQFLHEVKN